MTRNRSLVAGIVTMAMHAAGGHFATARDLARFVAAQSTEGP